MLNDFIDEVLADPAAKPVLDPITRLVAHARERDDWVVVYANATHRPGDFEFLVRRART